jgi:transcriptional regulator with XRE-family HTH domain
VKFNGERIKEARRNAKMTQDALGEAIGVTGVTIMRYEKNQREPGFEQLQAIADATGVTLWFLMGADDRTLDIFKRLDAEFMEARQASEETLLAEQLADAAEIDIWQRLDDQGRKLFSAFYDLNDKGQEAAIDYVQYLAEQEKYLK